MMSTPTVRRRATLRDLRGERGDMVDDLVARGAGAEHRADARRRQRRAFVVGHDAADDHADVAETGRAQRLDELRHDQVIGGERTDADRIDVLFHRQLDDGGDRLPGRRVDDVHAGVAQEGRHDPAAAIMAVETDLGDEHAGGRVEARRRLITPAPSASARRGASSSRAMFANGRPRPADTRPASS